MILISVIWYKNEMKKKIDKIENRTVRFEKRTYVLLSLRRIIIITDIKNTNTKKAGEKPNNSFSP